MKILEILLHLGNPAHLLEILLNLENLENPARISNAFRFPKTSSILNILAILAILLKIAKNVEICYNTFMKDFFLLFFNVLLTVIGQILFKQGMNLVGRIDNVRNALPKLTQAFLNPYILSGIAIYGFTTLVWLVILSRVKLSIAYPMLSSGYVLSILFSWLLFKESIPRVRVIGALVICIGVYLVAQGD